MKEREFNAVFYRDDKWVIAWTEDLPGAFGQDRTIEETRESLREAIVLILEEHARLHEDPSFLMRETISVEVP